MVAATAGGLKHAFFMLTFHFLFLTNHSRFSHHSRCSFQRGLFILCHRFPSLRPVLISLIHGQLKSYLSFETPLAPPSNVCTQAILFWFLTELLPQTLPRLFAKVSGQSSHDETCCKMQLWRLGDKVPHDTLFL